MGKKKITSRDITKRWQVGCLVVAFRCPQETVWEILSQVVNFNFDLDNGISVCSVFSFLFEGYYPVHVRPRIWPHILRRKIKSFFLPLAGREMRLWTLLEALFAVPRLHLRTKHLVSILQPPFGFHQVGNQRGGNMRNTSAADELYDRMSFIVLWASKSL